MRAKFGSDPTAGSKNLSFKFISRCLGVISGESLSWGSHVEYVKKTVSSKLGMLKVPVPCTDVF